jgi:hypothetical protein
MSRQQSSFISLATALVALTAASCIHHGQPAFRSEWPMVGSAATPAASGEVTVSRSSNGNTRLAIRVHHLAPPWRVAPRTGTYVAWVSPIEGAAPNNPPGQQGYPMTQPENAQPGATTGNEPPSPQGAPGPSTRPQGTPENARSPAQEPNPPGPPEATGSQAGAQPPDTTEQARASAPVNVGAIRLDSNLEGKLDTVTPLRQFQLMITPEPDASVQRPTNQPVLTATLR